uniref:DNA/RNA non-specific endonuclease n=1 Tax=Alistipes sp. TaxID=1872444 RepID=UPI003076E53C
EPRFGTPSFTEVGSSSAQLSCTYTYAGTESVSEAGFYYHTSGSTAEQKVAAAGVASPVACRLEGLAASTEYLAAAYVVVAGREYRSQEASFTTSAQSTGGGSAAKFSGWPELLAEDDSNSDYYYAYHLCPDLKTSRGDKARNYTVCFSAEHHCPVWVAAPRHESYEGSANRTNAYKADPDIPADIQYYSKSTGGGCNKGHMLGSAERTCTSSVNRQVFYYSNIAPQYSSGFNTGGGGWNILEDWIDTKVCADTTYLVIGTYFEKYTDRYGNSASPKKISFGDRDDVSCPTMFYIAVLRTKSGNTEKSVVECSADELMCAVFVRCHNNNLKGKAVSAKDMISVRELEQLTGFDYFPNVPNAPKDTYNPSDWGL